MAKPKKQRISKKKIQKLAERIASMGSFRFFVGRTTMDLFDAHPFGGFDGMIGDNKIIINRLVDQLAGYCFLNSAQINHLTGDLS